MTINTDNTITYTPASGYNGSDSFTYTIADGADASDTATATVYVNVANGQWASSVAAYSSQDDNGPYGSSIFALGTPDVHDYGRTQLNFLPTTSGIVRCPLSPSL